MGGGSDTTNATNVTNTGLGDDQYTALTGNQVGISGQITDATTDATERYDTFDTRFDTLDTSVGDVGTNVTSGFTNIQDLLDQYNTGMNTQFDQVNTGVGNNSTALSDNATALGGLQTDVTGGFNTMGTRFDTVDTNTGNIQTAVDQGFVDQSQGFTDAQADRTTQFADAATSRDASFAAAGDAMNQGFTDTSAQLTDTQANVLGGQGELQTNLDTMANTADAYAVQTLENQGALQSGQDSFVSNFDNYVERYADDTSLANQTRTDMQTANANANQKLREDVGSFAQAAATGQKNLSNDINVASSGLEKRFVAGLANLDAGQIIQSRDLARLASNNARLDTGMREEFNQLGNAFDNTGRLVESSIDGQGNTLTRRIDADGNLLLDVFDVMGRNVDNKLINIRKSFQNLSDMNASGFASPAAAAR